MTNEEYHAAPGLSNSGLKHLAVSPLRYWHRCINPNREKETTPFLDFGQALHTAILEPDEFEERYACRVNPADYPGILDTVADMKAWLKAQGLPVTHRDKDEYIEKIKLYAGPEAPLILQCLDDEQKASGKTLFKGDDWARITGAADALKNEPRLQEILSASDGQREISLFANDPETGVLVKCRLDFWSPTRGKVDLKTFTQKRSMTIGKTVTDAIWYERYWIQSYWYSWIESLQKDFARPGIAAATAPFYLAFVESDPPHEVKLRELAARNAGEPNLYWETALLECRRLVRLYARYQDKFGDQPWRDEQEIDPLLDDELPGLLYG